MQAASQSGIGTAATPGAGSLTVRVWDPLVRIFHWSLVACFFTAYLIEDPHEVHETAGYIVIGLVCFRLVWGFIGSRHARFSDFARGPLAALSYLRDMAGGRAKRYLGHNPAGGAMILLLLFFVGLTAGSGWLSVTDRFWGVDWVEDLHEFAANTTVVLVAVHVAGAVTSSLAHRENLVIAMITGRKRS